MEVSFLLPRASRLTPAATTSPPPVPVLRWMLRLVLSGDRRPTTSTGSVRTRRMSDQEEEGEEEGLLVLDAVVG
eukprot:10669-Eustigmatos_ZCMA.PRE.1